MAFWINFFDILRIYFYFSNNMAFYWSVTTYKLRFKTCCFWFRFRFKILQSSYGSVPVPAEIPVPVEYYIWHFAEPPWIILPSFVSEMLLLHRIHHTPVVNFINVLRARFSYETSYSLVKFWQKRHFRTKNVRIKCWWNLHLWAIEVMWQLIHLER